MIDETAAISVLSEWEKEHSGNNAAYLYAVLRAGEEAGIVSAEEIADLQCDLWALLAKRTQRFTMDDSSSVPVETAQRLLHSVCFCIGLELWGSGGLQRAARRLIAAGVSPLFEKGRGRVKELLRKGRGLLEELKNTAYPTNNRAFRDTVFHALPAFFAHYDPDFLAHEIPCSIDYPLSYAVEGLEGVQYINEYIHRLLLENGFLARFDAEYVRRLLRGYCREPDEQLINLFEPVFTNAVGLALLQKDCMALNILDGDRYALLLLLRGCSGEELALRITEAVGRVCETAGIGNDSAVRAYLAHAGRELCARITLQLKQDDLRGLFPSFGEARRVTFAYTDGEPMPDEDLRALIEEMRTCRYTEDKLTMLKRQVKSLRDYIELLPECFEEEEYAQAFAPLSEEELAALLRLLYERLGEWPDPAESGWISALLKYIVAFPAQSKARILSMAGDAGEELR